MVLTVQERSPQRGDPAIRRTVTDCLLRAAEDAGEEAAWTFLDYSASPDGVAHTVNRATAAVRMRAVAAWLRERVEPGERVAILAPQGLEYVVGFLGALHAGVIGVPLFSPDLPGHADRLERVLADCAPACVLTDAASLPGVRSFLEPFGANGPRHCAAVEDIPDSAADGFTDPDLDPDDVAYLQYTSGSTRTPTGVQLSHRNVLVNAEQALQAYCGDDRDVVAVSWLPLFHDMGLVLAVAAPAVGGFPSVLMDPAAFLQRPGRWLRQLSEHPGAITAAPNFAYDYCVSRVSDEEKDWLRLDDVAALINGSEPVRASTVERFNATFAPCGLEPDTHRSAFGLAEATVFVAVTELGTEPAIVTLNREQLAADRAEPVLNEHEPGSTLVSCGQPGGQHVAIVHPSHRTVLPDGDVGEIWVHGPNVGQGYFSQDSVGPEGPFGAELLEPARDLPSSGWLRTGDLGVWHRGELFITGRMKDLIIIDGRNHYPQDVEETVEGHPSVRGHHTAAFAVPTADAEAEQLVVVAEWSRKLAEAERDTAEVTRAVRAEIIARHSVRLAELLLVEPDTVPRTSSGKVARQGCRDLYQTGALAPAGTSIVHGPEGNC